MKPLKLSVFFILALTLSCSQDSKSRQIPPPQDETTITGEANSAADQNLAIKEIKPNLVGDFQDYEDGNTRCAGHRIGDIILQKSPSSSALFCLGEYKVEDDIFLDEPASVKEYTDIYVALYTSTVEGVTDLSYVTIFENETSIDYGCGGTNHSPKTSKIRHGFGETDTANPNQMQALVSGKGICPHVFLKSPTDRDAVTAVLNGKTVELSLTKIK